MDHIKLSVVIPAYNETKNLSNGSLDLVDSYLKKQPYSYEVLIIDDGSTDGTPDLVEKLIKDKKGFKLIRNPHGGKALTVITGMLQTQGEIAVFTDMDQATPLNQIEKFFPKFEEGFDIVIGSRGGRKGAPVIRKITALSFSLLRKLIIGLSLADTQCGFKAFTQRAVKLVFPKILELRKGLSTSGAALNAGFDVETLYLAKKTGLQITEVLVDWHYVGTNRFNLMKDAVDAVRDMLEIRFNDLIGKYSVKVNETD